MAKRNKPVVGLDIDPVGIHAAQVSLSGGRTVIERAAVLALEPGVVRDGEIQDVEALAEALKTLYRDNKGLDRRVRVGVANQKLAVRTVDLPVIEDRKELDAAVRFQAQDVIPMPLDQAVLDWQPLALVETPEGTRQRVLLVAARKDMVDRVVAAVRAAGLRLDGIDLGAFAMIRALHEGADEPETVLYAAVGGITNLAVARGNQPLFSRASGGGLEAIAVELAERRSLTLEHARGWLQHVGLSTPVEAIEGDAEIVADARHVLEEGVRKIGAEVRQTLDFHQMQVDGSPVSRVVLTGEAIAVEGFADGLGIELGLPVSAGSVAGEPDGITTGRLTVAAGLAAGGDPSVNVLPAEERRAAGTAGRSEGAVYAVLGVLALALVLLTVNVLAKNGVADKEADLAEVTAEVATTEETAKSLASYTDFAALREKRVETVRQIAEQPLRLGARARRGLAHDPQGRVARHARRLGHRGRRRRRRRRHAARRHPAARDLDRRLHDEPVGRRARHVQPAPHRRRRARQPRVLREADRRSRRRRGGRRGGRRRRERREQVGLPQRQRLRPQVRDHRLVHRAPRAGSGQRPARPATRRTPRRAPPARARPRAPASPATRRRSPPTPRPARRRQLAQYLDPGRR